jgi:hypothetical protein
LVYAVLSGTQCQVVAEAHVDPHVRNRVPGITDLLEDSLQRVYRNHVFLSAKRLCGAPKSARSRKVN